MIVSINENLTISGNNFVLEQGPESSEVNNFNIKQK